MTEEDDPFSYRGPPAERMQVVMLALFDLVDEARVANFPEDLVSELNQVRLKFMDEFEARFPGYGKGRAVWR